MVGKLVDGLFWDFLFWVIDYCYKLVVDKYIINGNDEMDEYLFIWFIDSGCGGV